MRSREAMVTVVTFIGAVGAVLLVIGVAWSAAVPVVPGWFLWLGAIVSGAGAGLLILAAVVAWRWHHAARRITRWERRGDRWISLDGTGAERQIWERRGDRWISLDGTGAERVMRDDDRR